MGYGIVVLHHYISFTEKTLKNPLYNQRLEGRVLSIQDQTRRKHILFENNVLHPVIPKRIRFTISAENYDKLFPDDRVIFHAHLYPLPSALYEGDYDFSFYAKATGIGAIGSIQTIEKILRPAWSLGRTLEQLRRHIKEIFHHHLSKEPASIMTAMITGDRSGIPAEVNEIWKEAGIYHLLSISGLHMTVIAGLMFFIFRRMMFLCPPLVRHYDTKKIAAVASIVCSGFYTLLSGGAVPVIRSFITVSVIMCAILLDRQALSIRTTSVAYLLILAFSPTDFFDISFGLSFAAVVGIVLIVDLLGEYKRSHPHHNPKSFFYKIIMFVSISFCAGTAGMPLAVYAFGQTSVYGFLCNLIAVPLTSLLLMPPLALSIVMMPFGLEFYFLFCADYALAMLQIWANYIAHLPYNMQGADTPLPFMLILFYVGLYLSAICRYGSRLIGASLMMLAIICYLLFPTRSYILLSDNKTIAFKDKKDRLHLITHDISQKPDAYKAERLARGLGLHPKNPYYISYCYDRTVPEKFITRDNHILYCTDTSFVIVE